MPRHLLSGDTIARATALAPDAARVRGKGQGNGLRVHAIVFGLMALGTLVVVVSLISVTSARM